MVLTPSGGAGSIGVVAMHVDVSAAMADAGVKVTYITAGDHKVDGNPYEPLSADVKADIQAEINTIRDAFVARVARNRKLSNQAVLDTQARCYYAADALSLGLVDVIASPDTALEAYSNDNGDDDDEADDLNPSMQQENDMTITPEQNAASISAAATEARTSERTRIAGITNHAEATGREKLAAHLAHTTDMSVEAAAGILAASPKEAAPVAATATPVDPNASAPAPNLFARQMNRDGGAGVAPDANGGEGEGDNDEGSKKPSLVANVLRLTGQKDTSGVARRA